MKEYIFTNGFVLNTKQKKFTEQSVLVRKDRITSIGTLQDCKIQAKSSYEIIDLKKRLLLPAFIDAHTHFVEYAKGRILVNLASCHTIEEICNYLINYREKLSYKPLWILGGGWNRNCLNNPQELSCNLLDAIFPDIPVALMSKDYHSKLCNSLALKIAGINKNTDNPKSGLIEHDKEGNLTGVLYETAGELINSYIIYPEEKVFIQAISETVESIYPLGLVGFNSMESILSRDLMLKTQEQGKKFRFCWHFYPEDYEKVLQEGKKSYEGDEFYKLGGLKLFGDGSLGSQTAAMFENYPAGGNGILRYTDEELYNTMLSAAENGFAATIHAIGNRCVKQVIDCALRLKSSGKFNMLFNRIEHIQAIRKEDIPLLKKAELFASLQPIHIANDVLMIEKHWKDVIEQAYSIKSIITEGISYAFGSDVPIETINPFQGIYSALERHPDNNPALPQFRPEQSISAMEAILGYTIGAAKSSKSEKERGSIETGKLADLIVIEDYRKFPSTFWLTAKSELTMLNGEIVFPEG